MSDHEQRDHAASTSPAAHTGRKRPRQQQPPSDPRYPRKRSLKACHVCRARKTKCDNKQPTCGFCASLGIPCSYDAAEKDHSTEPGVSFDPASLEILRQLSHVISSQDQLLDIVRSVATSPSQCVTSDLVSSSGPAHARRIGEDVPNWEHTPGVQQRQLSYVGQEGIWFGTGQIDSPTSTTSPSAAAASASVAAVRWFGLLANDASREAALQQEDHDDAPPLLDAGGFLDPSDGQKEDDMTPLQRATRLIDNQPPATRDEGMTHSASSGEEERLWAASENIALLDREQALFENFLHRICPWLDLFDPACTFSTRVPHLAVRNAGLLNSILALSCYHQQSLPDGERNPGFSSSAHDVSADKNSSAALQYYYQTLHYVQRAMRYPSYQASRELMATTLVVSTYEMLRGSRRDWQRHLRGVFWILRSRGIDVEQPGLESTTWWAWLRQDIWAAFRERRRIYSTWTPRKTCAELSAHELATRSLWLLAQVVNFCALDGEEEGAEGRDGGGAPAPFSVGRLGWAKALWRMLDEWAAHLTAEFSPLPGTRRMGASDAFQPRLIHPPCFGLAMQVHHTSRILLCAHEPYPGRIDAFMRRQKLIAASMEMVCGIGMTFTEDAFSMLSSQCLFIAGMFMQDPRQKKCVLEMLDSCRNRCAWPTLSLGEELEKVWEDPNSFWGTL